MSKNTTEKSIEQVQKDLGKLVDSVESCVSVNGGCYPGICDKLRKKRNLTGNDKKLWNKCGCR